MRDSTIEESNKMHDRNEKHDPNDANDMEGRKGLYCQLSRNVTVRGATSCYSKPVEILWKRVV